MLNAIAAAGLVASLLVPASTYDTSSTEETAAPGAVSAEIVTVMGSGCPNGTGSAKVSGDGNTVTISSPSYLALAGVEAKPTDFRKNCQIALSVKKPANYTYAVVRADAKGFAYLGKGATGVARTSYYFQGASPTAAESHTFSGPMSDEWKATDVAGVDARLWAPCGAERYLNINTELRVNIGSADKSETNIMWRGPTTKLHLAWKRCAA